MNFRARYYDPATGEFISQDPKEYVDGMSMYRGYFVPNGVDPSGNENGLICNLLTVVPDPRILLDVFSTGYDMHYNRNRFGRVPVTEVGAIKAGMIPQPDSKAIFHNFPTERITPGASIIDKERGRSSYFRRWCDLVRC